MSTHSSPHEARSRGLSELLRTRRLRLQPADVGLPMGSRRRTQGLRREEVAMLAGISTTYYVFLEQGRAARPSRRVVDALADALQFDPTERALLHALALDMTEEAESAYDAPLDPTLSEIVMHLDPKPAYVTGRYWDVLAANRAARLLWTDWHQLAPPERNMLRWVLTAPAARNILVEWEQEAIALTARFRAAAMRHPEDPAFQLMAEQLMADSPSFKDWWPRHEVAPLTDGTKILRHCDLGEIQLRHIVLQVASNSDHKLVVFQPTEEDQEKIENLLTQAGAWEASVRSGSNAGS
ncbi:helix-turn-helix transcriptional regulator [Acidihalobacter prosperus]|nr:helix-turn-helix transcriptional regulator [Acidihalobacter prosperus]